MRRGRAGFAGPRGWGRERRVERRDTAGSGATVRARQVRTSAGYGGLRIVRRGFWGLLGIGGAGGGGKGVDEGKRGLRRVDVWGLGALQNNNRPITNNDQE